MRDRFVVGVGTGASYSVGDTGGANTVTLTVAQMPPSHTHTLFKSCSIKWWCASSAYVSSNSGTVNTGSTGGGQSHENRPPYYALCYIIKHTATTGGMALLPAQTINPAAQATSVEFTNIPADALEITVMFEGASLSGTDDFEIQLGTASGYIVSNYDSMSQNEGGADKRNSTSSFILRSDNASYIRTGSMLIKKASDTSYVQTGQFAISPSSTVGGNQTYGSLSSVSGTVNKLRIKSSGSNHFDAGSISVLYTTSGSGGGGSLIKLGTVATNTGTEAAFTSIPSTQKNHRGIHNFGYAGNNDELIMEVGDSTGYYQSGYQSSYDAKDDQPDAQSRTNAYGLSDDTNSGLEQNITVELVNVTGNSWTISHQGAASISGGRVIHGGGSISLTNSLDRLRIKTVNGRYS